jgi:hypothetical protein
MSEPERVTKVINITQQPYKIRVTRGQKGGVGWQISVEAESQESALAAVEAIDRMLAYRFKGRTPLEWEEEKTGDVK